MMTEEIKEIASSQYSSPISLTIFTFSCILMLPIMLIRNFNSIKILGVIITVLNFSLIGQALVFFIYDAAMDSS